MDGCMIFICLDRGAGKERGGRERGGERGGEKLTKRDDHTTFYLHKIH